MNFILAFFLVLSSWMTPEAQKGIVELTSADGMSEIRGETYYIENNSIQTDTTKKIGDNTFSFDKDGKMKTGLQTEDGSLYYYGEDGVRQTGFQTINNSTYYFNKETGKAETGVVEVDDATYCFDEDYKMQTGFINGYLYDETGKRVAGGWHNEQYYDQNGKLATGITKIDNTYYNLNAEGKPETGYVDNKYFNNEGKLFVGEGNTEDNMYIKTKKNGEITYYTSAQAQLAVESAYRQIGVDQWCTELVNNALKDAGLVPQGTYEWYKSIGHWVDEPRPGDICMYPGHVALYVGNGVAIHGGYFTGNGGKTTKEAPVQLNSKKCYGYIRVFGE